MAKRKSLSIKTRFDVFKRDAFTCGYCGASPPSVVLEVDHIIAVANGGDNSADNLLTSCFDCNRGKGAHKLNVISPSVQERAAILVEKEAQLKAYAKLQASIERRKTKSVAKVEEAMQSYFDGSFTDSFKVSVKYFLENFTQQELVDHMITACERINDPNEAVKYFCGICWTRIKRRKNHE